MLEHIHNQTRIAIVDLINQLSDSEWVSDECCSKLIAIVTPDIEAVLVADEVLPGRVGEAHRRGFHAYVANKIYMEGEEMSHAVRRLLQASLKFAGIRSVESGPGTTAIMRAITNELGNKVSDETIRAHLFEAVRAVIRGYRRKAFPIAGVPNELVASVERHAYLCLLGEDLYIGQLVRRARHFGLRQNFPGDNDEMIYPQLLTNFVCACFQAAGFTDPSHITPQIRLPEDYYPDL